MFWLLAYIVVIWLVEILNTIGGHHLNHFGIVPRTPAGLGGIFFGPFLHTGFSHLISNTAPLLILGALVRTRGKNALFGVTIAAILVSGLGTWLVGRSGIHIGASGLVFAYFGYLIAIGWYERSFSSIMISVMVIVFYGGLIFAALPLIPNISWEGHMFGLVTGLVYARVGRQRIR